MPLFDAECLRNGTRLRYCYNTNWDLTHALLKALSFRMTSSGVAKFLMTRSITRSVYDSWASCHR